MKLPTITEIVKNNDVRFSYYRAGMFYYRVTVKDNHYLFPVPSDELGEATLHAQDRAIYFMRYIRKAIADKTFVIEV